MKITFLGADRTVTGSCHMLEVNGKRILVDCGMFQGSKAVRSFNSRPFAFNPGEIDAVLLTHAHIDHSGLIPKLVAEGYKGSVHTTKVTKQLCDILLPDSAHIQEADAEINNRKGKRAGRPEEKPLYTVDEAYAALKHFVTHNFNEEITLLPGVKVVYRVAGHILGSAFLELYIEEDGQQTKIIFTGDIGQPNQPIIQDPVQITGADFIITESTYGDRVHEAGDREQELCDILKEALAKGGNVIIPAFAVGRTQTLLYYFQKLMGSGALPEVPIVVDSPMAIEATKVTFTNPSEYDEEAQVVYDEMGGRLINMPNVTYIQTAEQSRAVNEMPGPMIILSASGMADAGRVLHHLKHNLWRADSSVIFAGYQAEESLGRRLVEGAKRVKIMGEDIVVRAKIYNMKGFSAHADREQMLAWYKGMEYKPKAFFVVHGELKSALSFGETLRNKLGTAVGVPSYGDSVTITGTEWNMAESEIVTSLPALVEFKDFAGSLDGSFAVFRSRMEQRVLNDGAYLSTAKSKLNKLKAYIEDLLRS